MQWGFESFHLELVQTDEPTLRYDGVSYWRYGDEWLVRVPPSDVPGRSGLLSLVNPSVDVLKMFCWVVRLSPNCLNIILDLHEVVIVDPPALDVLAEAGQSVVEHVHQHGLAAPHRPPDVDTVWHILHCVEAPPPAGGTWQ